MRRVLLTLCFCATILLIAEWVFIRNTTQRVKEFGKNLFFSIIDLETGKGEKS